MNSKNAALSFFFGGLLPVIAFTVIEDKYGTVPGIFAGIFFGVGEILWEALKYKKVSPITWGANVLVVLLGLISLVSKDGLFFKLQPSIMEAIFSVAFIGSVLLGRPLLLILAEKQKQTISEPMKKFFPGFSLRIGIFFGIHALLATWAAFYWSTNAWAFLKGIGLTVSFVVYLFAEIYWMRAKQRS